MKNDRSNASNNDAVEAKIKKLLREKGPLQNWDICSEASLKTGSREIDRGLQRLRKAGEIELVSKTGFGRRWKLKEKET